MPTRRVQSQVLEAARSAKSGEGDPQLMAARARQGSHDSAVPRPPKSSKPRCCTETTDLDAAAFLEHLQALPG